MCAYAVQVSVDATAISRETLDDLRANGFTDEGILQITLIASWFNYINRVADALGVGRDEPGTSCQLPVPPAPSWQE